MNMTSIEAKEERAFLRVWVGRVLALISLLILTAWVTGAYAQPILQASADGVKVVIYEEPCKVDAVANLPKRATWHEKGKVYEGCMGAHPHFPVLMGYFVDKTVVILPVEMFSRVSGA